MGRIISCEEKKEQFRIMDIDHASGTVSLVSINDPMRDDLVVRAKDIE